jgi:hypothetical protein
MRGVLKGQKTNLLDLAHHLISLSSLCLGLASQFLVLGLETLHLLAKIVTAASNWSRALSLVSSLGLFLILGELGILQAGVRVHAPQVLVEILLSREALAGVALAVDVRAVQLLSRASVLVVDLALMSEQTTRVGEAGKLLASLGRALVRAIVLVHVFRPLALSTN